MASITNYDTSRGIVLPTWFLGCAVAAFFTVSGAAAYSMIDTWATARENKADVASNSKRLDRLEDLYIDVAGMKSDLAATKQLTQSTNTKLDGFITLELQKKNGR